MHRQIISSPLVIPLEYLLVDEDHQDIKQAQLVHQVKALIAEHSFQDVLSGLSIACAQITRNLQVQQVAGESLYCPDEG
jgi:hypothetical protein